MLPNRRQKILAAIVEQYIATGEPVGSNALLSKLDISVSSATIRNDMAVLTKLGYIYQPHTSAGRIPTQSGYRYYVDNLMQVAELGESDRRRIEAGVDERSGDPEALLTKAGEALVDFTNYAAVATTPSDEHAVIKNVEIVPVSPRVAMIVLMTSTGILKSKACRADMELTPALLETCRSTVAEAFVGKPLAEIGTVMIQTLVASLGAQALTLSPLFSAIADLAEEASQSQVRLEGQSSLLGYREYADNLPELLNFLHQSGPLGMLLSSGDPSSETGIEVRIGSENRYKELSGSTTIISRYRIGDRATGAIGIIGPTRMNYSRLIPSIKYLSDIVSKTLSDVYEEDMLTDERHKEEQEDGSGS